MSFEALVADVAFVHFLPFVEGQDVALEGVRSGVGLVAHMTLVLLRNYSMYEYVNSNVNVNNG